MRLEIAAGRADELRAALGTLAGLRVDVTQASEPRAARASLSAGPVRNLATLDLVGSDSSGILREVSAVLAEHGSNVEDLASERVEAPMGEGKLFQLRGVVSVPPKIALARMRTDLEHLAADLMVELKPEKTS